MMDRLLAAARSNRHRLPLVFRGSLASARETFRILDPVVLTQESPAPSGSINPGQARALLGQEIPGAIVDTGSGIDADAVGIVSGAIRSGGVLCFVVAHSPGHNQSLYLQRLIRLLETDSQVTVLGYDDGCQISAPPVVDNDLEAGGDTATRCQANAVEQVQHVITGQRRRPTILVADRGRGKSAALGIAAGRLLAQGHTPIVVTGSSRRGVDAVFRHAEAVHPPGSAHLTWLNPDRLERENVECQLLLIDEAASLSLPLLEKLIRRFPRVAMATTVHGYEGSGRGFLLRFREMLEHYTRGYRWIDMHTPIRWAPDDPLEMTTNRVLVLDAEVEPLDEQRPARTAPINVETVTRLALAVDEPLLRKVFGLLVLSHYKTKPNDLQRLLDNPAVTILLARQKGLLVGVAVTVAEGGLSPALVRDIASGKRRPAGHVLPELLAINGFPSAAGLRIQRIIRIVVHPARRRLGVGSHLLAKATHIEGDLIGANFALSAPTIKFWLGNGYQPIQIGRRKTVQGGSHSGTMIKAIGEHAEELVEKALDRFLANLPARLGTTLSSLDARSVQALMVNQPQLKRTPSAETIAEITDVVRRGRDPDSVAGSLAIAAIHGIANDWFKSPLPVIERVLQHRQWHDVTGQSPSTGWRRGNMLIREMFQEYIQGMETPAPLPENKP